ncbi:MAG TPA: ATP citrate lyase citrate-binding domain-containing protein [Candidatus Magasanikbacteria bacterium]|nr:ATP citrate lyase citrate-binding domain-containing protein [Candidatus Magasanikbacteria bacterium]
MNLYEFEGKELFATHGIAIPKGVVVRRGDSVSDALNSLGVVDVVVKAQVLSGKRGKNNAIRFCSSVEEVTKACDEIFQMQVRGQYVAAIRIEEKLAIAEEHYLSITYNSISKQPILVYSKKGGVDIEDVLENDIRKIDLDIRKEDVGVTDILFAQELWNCFLQEDTRQVEINPLVKTTDGKWIAADAKVALDDDAFYRHESWKNFEARTMMGRPSTEREKQAALIDAGEDYYRGTAGKYIEMDGDVAVLFSSAGASIANMDALIKAGLKPANYTEYSGNPPREKVYQLTKVVLSKPGVKGLWIIGGVANFTNVKDTFAGIVEALDEIKPTYPIVVRRGGPYAEEGLQLMKDCAERNHLNMKIFGKETSMSETAGILAAMIV